jgi:ABC-type antimicrobial peptide transport system permease subunit
MIISGVLREALVQAVAGLAVGAAGAMALSGVLRSQLYGLGPGDPLTFAVVAVTLVAVALLASWIPARRAASVDPAVPLRAE